MKISMWACGRQFNLHELVNTSWDFKKKKKTSDVYISNSFSFFVCVNPVFKNHLTNYVACVIAGSGIQSQTKAGLSVHYQGNENVRELTCEISLVEISKTGYLKPK